MQAFSYIIVRNGFSVNFSIRGSSEWWSHVSVTALAIQVSLPNPMATMEDSMTSMKTLYILFLTFFSRKIMIMFEALAWPHLIRIP